jgi:hypothetical protein
MSIGIGMIQARKYRMGNTKIIESLPFTENIHGRWAVERGRERE